MRAIADGRDPLTGVLGRERLNEEIARAADECARFGDAAALLVIDLDHFRMVNDAHGHAAGDALLIAIAAAIGDRLRATDAVGRVGSDEFAVVLRRTDLDTARTLAHELLGAVRAAGQGELAVSASVGIAVIGPGAAPSELLADADMAMAAAKESGRDRVALADPGALARVRTSLSWAARIREALETGGLELHAQPIVPLARDRGDRHELLVRMRGGAGVIAPGEFLPTAERFGQIQSIDGWVVGRALDLLARTPRGGPVLHVNLAAASIGDAQLMTFIERAVIASDVDPSRLVFEITETAAIADLGAARTTVERLRALGCRLALDDFGTGFGSFAYLKHLPFDLLKVAGDFVEDLPNSVIDRLTVKAMAEIASALHMHTVAEYVTDDETLAVLKELSVDFAQGWHTGRPRPVAAIWR